MRQEELRKLQGTQLKMMDLIHDFCVKNDIKYYMIGGTLLGAVRHKGFIPWDLDIDIAMMREDYNKFKKLSFQLPACLEYHDFNNLKKYSRPHCEVSLKHTMINCMFDKYNKNKMYNGVFIDIFPLDYAPDEEKLQIKQRNKIKKIRRIISFKEAVIYGNKGLLYKIAKKIIAFCMMPLSYKYLGKMLEKNMTKYNSTNSKLVCSMASHYDYFKQRMPKEIYGSPVLMEFENRMYFAPSCQDEYLKRIYGDYMVLPPEEKRKGEMDLFESVDYCYVDRKYKKGYTTGVFDMFHIGHLNIISTSKKYCKKLIVGVSTDELVFNRKNKFPIINYDERCKILNSIKYIDLVIPQENMNKIDNVIKYKIDVVFVGSDWQWTEQWMNYEKMFNEIGVDVVYIPHTEGISSSILREKLNEYEK